MLKLKKGFLPALGTPLDKDGGLVEASFKKQIDDQIKSGAVGLLCMGSMGIQATVRGDVYPTVVRAAVEAAAGRVPVFVGAMDNSIARAKVRIESVADLDVAGYVFTAPYYSAVSQSQAMTFFEGVCDATDRNILLYDLPSVTQSKITYGMVLELLSKKDNFVGIKTADTAMLRKLKLNPDVSNDFAAIYSGLDIFDVAYKWGIGNCLDGMLTCTPRNTEKMFAAMERDDYTTAAECLSRIVELRDLFLAFDIWPAYSYTMNLLGYEGNFAPDYCGEVKEECKKSLYDTLRRIGEL